MFDDLFLELFAPNFTIFYSPIIAFEVSEYQLIECEKNGDNCQNNIRDGKANDQYYSEKNLWIENVLASRSVVFGEEKGI